MNFLLINIASFKKSLYLLYIKAQLVKKYKFRTKYTIWKNDLISQRLEFIFYVKIIKVIIEFFFMSTDKYLFCIEFFIFFTFISLIILFNLLLWNTKKLFNKIFYQQII